MYDGLERQLLRAPLKIQMACGGETSRNSAAHLRPVGKRPIGVDSAFCAENELVSWRPFLLFRFLLGAQKKMKTELRTTKSRLNCSLRR